MDKDWALFGMPTLGHHFVASNAGKVLRNAGKWIRDNNATVYDVVYTTYEEGDVTRYAVTVYHQRRD